MGIFLLFFNSSVYSLERKSNQKFIHYSTRDGLSGRYQTSFVQDNDGFIWIGTTEGLNRFDGYEFKVYRHIPGDSTSLGSSDIATLYVDSYGTLWIGTINGSLYRYNKDQDNFSSIKDKHENQLLYVSYIVEDHRRMLWMVTLDALCLFDPVNNRLVKTFIYETGQDKLRSLASKEIRTLAVDSNTIWIGYGSGIFSALNTKTNYFKHFRLPFYNNNSTENFINSLCVDGDKLWMTTWGKGVWVFDKKSQLSYPYEGIKSVFVNWICKDNKNTIWIGTESDGLVSIDKRRSTTTVYAHDDYNKNSLSNNSISCIFVDRQNNLWLGNKKGDMHYFIVDNPFRFWIRNPLNSSELSNSDVTCMLETEDQNLWVGFQNGGLDILNLKEKTRRYIDNRNDNSKFGKNIVTTIYKDSDQELWLGTYLGGLKKYNKASEKFLTFLQDTNNINSLSGNDIRKIAKDSKGDLWIAVHGGGLNRLNKRTGKINHFRVNYADLTSSPVVSDWLTSLFCDREDNIWIGTVSGASFLASSLKASKHFQHDPKDSASLSNNYVNIIFGDSDGTIWIGTNNGLNRFNKETNKFTRFFVKDGLPNDQILGILEDNNKNLWISTNKGLACFLKKNLIFKRYTIDDGLLTDEFNNNSCFKNSRGELYFGGINGMFVFHPDSIKSNNIVPPVYLTDFKLFNQSVTYKNSDILKKPIQLCKQITLEYSQNIIGFEFVALNYMNQQKNLYSYKMEGFDKEWSVPGTKREVTYTNLHHGSYTFKVKASNNDGVWNETGATIEILIKPPFWKTNWAFFFYLILLGILLYIFRFLILRDSNIKRKLEFEIMEVEKLQEMDNQKMQFFSNISHEFRTPLTLIIGPLEILMSTSKDEFQQTNFKLIHRNAQRLLRLINQLMDFRKIEVSGLEINYVKGDIIRFILDLSNVFTYEAQQRNVSFSVKTNIDQLYTNFDKDKLDKILYNLLSNAFKFTPDNGFVKLFVKIDLNMDKLHIIVEDTGKGIPENVQSKIFERFYQVENIGSFGTGIGLALTKELVQLLNGKIGVESVLGKGSKFTVTLPLIKQIEPSNNKEPIDSKNTDENGNQSQWNYFDIQNIPKNKAMSNEVPEGEALPILLIVEDSADMRLYIRNEFINSYHVLEATNGEMGLEKAIVEIPDIIISDVMMPGLDGIEFCNRIKSDEKTCHIPIVLLTALSSDDNTVKGLKSGADDYIIKPFNSMILKLKVRNIVESRKLFQSRFVKEPTASIKEIALSALDEKFLKKAYEVVEQNIDNPNLDVNDFTAAVGMSRAQLYRKINALTGQSVKEFIRIIRLKKAAEMLLNENKNIKEIAPAVGFSSITYFTKSFSDYYGVPPMKYISLNK